MIAEWSAVITNHCLRIATREYAGPWLVGLPAPSRRSHRKETDDNLVLVGFTEQSKAYHALSRLRQAGETGQLEVRAAALLERGPDGVVRVPDGDDAAPGVAIAGGGLIGMLIGVAGWACCWAPPPARWPEAVAAAAHSGDQDIALAAISGQIEPGHTVLVAEVGEAATEVVDTAMAALGGTVTRRSAADVYDEIQSAKAAQDAAETEARRVLREQRRAEHKDKWEQFKENNAAVR